MVNNKDGPCRYEERRQNIVRVKGILRGKTGDEKELQRLIAFVGPTTVPMDASRPTFQFYSSGLFKVFSFNC
jgi:hypothetical protein